MAHAISQTVTSVVGSSITTIAGFLAMCFMTFTLGMDLGIVMAKGVVFGVIGCVTILPSMVLVFDKWLEKTKHKPLLPDLGKIGGFVTKTLSRFYFVVSCDCRSYVLCPEPQSGLLRSGRHASERFESVAAGDALEEEFHMGATHVILADSSLPKKKAYQMEKELQEVKGVKAALGLDAVTGPLVPDAMVPEHIREVLDNGRIR